MSFKYISETDTLEEVIDSSNLYDFFSSKGYFFSNEVLTRYYLSLKTKPFVILSGISGTGKTKIAQLFAEYMCQHDEQDVREKKIAFISVRPDWMDNKALLGYYNILDERYHSTKLLDLLMEAIGHPKQPYFVILDEMNLAKVEHYFSDFLSILESRTSDKPDGEMIALHSLDNVQTPDGREVPKAIRIPPNVFFAGTVNVDESTYMFSPKVLDRANVIEFNDVDLKAYTGEMQQKDELILINSVVLDRFFEQSVTPFCRKVDYTALDPRVKQYVNELQDILIEYNLHFGYRVANELGKFVNLAVEEIGEACLDDAMDIQIMQKILPKLHGTRARLEVPLQQLLVLCFGETVFSEELLTATQSTSQHAPFPRSAGKLIRMLKQLAVQGYASFVE